MGKLIPLSTAEIKFCDTSTLSANSSWVNPHFSLYCFIFLPTDFLTFLPDVLYFTLIIYLSFLSLYN
nr:MAG TPA: hypothetical protein [Caudoviricetes sp.]